MFAVKSKFDKEISLLVKKRGDIYLIREEKKTGIEFNTL
jgi:hypothetical protein